MIVGVMTTIHQTVILLVDYIMVKLHWKPALQVGGCQVMMIGRCLKEQLTAVMESEIMNGLAITGEDMTLGTI